MSSFVAALPMYDWPETRADTDAEWARIAEALRREGIEAPTRLARRNANLPPVPGGIRDAEGRVIAPDPATLPPDEFDLPVLWRHPALLLAQTCWGPMEAELEPHVRVIGQPDYTAYEGGEGPFYSSAIVIRRGDKSQPVGTSSPPRSGGEVARAKPETVRGTLSPGTEADFRTMKGMARKGIDLPAPDDGTASIPLDVLRGKRLAFSEPASMSGFLALKRDLKAAGESLSLFSGMLETGSHRASVLAVAEGRADVCAVDCRSWTLMRRYEPAAAALSVVGWTARRPGLPFITSRRTPPELLAILRRAAGALP